MFFNRIFDLGIVPKSWCASIITPIYKSGSKMDPSNYRGISLLNVIYKYFHLYLIMDLQNGLTTSIFWMNVKTVSDVTIWQLTMYFVCKV